MTNDDDDDVVDEEDDDDDDDNDNVNLGTNCGGADVDSSSSPLPPSPPVVVQFSVIPVTSFGGGGGGLTIGLIVSFGIIGADDSAVGNLMMVLIGVRSRFKLILSGSTRRCCLHIVSELVVVVDEEDGDVDVDDGAEVVEDDRESDAELSSTSTMSSMSTERCSWCC